MLGVVIQIGKWLVGSLLASGLILLILRKFVEVFIARAVGLEYDKRSESFKAELKTKHEVAMEQLRAVQSLASLALMEIHKGVAERQLQAIETLWRAILKVTDTAPWMVAMTDMTLKEHYAEMIKGLTSADPNSSLSRENLGKYFDQINKLGQSADEVRPFSGETLYSLVFTYRAVVGGIALSLVPELQENGVKPWYDDPHIRDVLKRVFDESDMAEFDAFSVNRYSWLRLKIESKFLEAASKIVSGRQAADQGFEQAEELIAAASKLQNQTREQSKPPCGPNSA